MAGHFRKRGSRWYFWIELEPGPNGERRQRSMGGFRTRREAELAFAGLGEEIRKGDYVEPSRLTVESFFRQEWLPGIRPRVRPTTWDHYRRMAEACVYPTIGSRRLADLSPAQLNALYAGLLQDGRRQARPDSDRHGLSPTTVRHVHTMLHTALRDAVRWGHLSRNPADQADPPRPATREMRAWSPEELRRFLHHVGSDRLSAAWLLLATTGMRRGELLGLRWREVDINARWLAVVRAHVLVNRMLVDSESKTARSRRTIALDSATVVALRRYRQRQFEERLALGEHWQDTGLVFTHEDGSAISPRLFRSWFTQLARRAGLPAIRLHDIRHSYATAALAAGVPAKIVSERLGHANIVITLDTYSHVLPNMQEEAAEQVAKLILER